MDNHLERKISSYLLNKVSERLSVGDKVKLSKKLFTREERKEIARIYDVGTTQDAHNVIANYTPTDPDGYFVEFLLCIAIAKYLERHNKVATLWVL